MLNQLPVAEEFNKYLSYVRNLGFEDTPDYDYLRDLFTQALKNAGEVEDGEYDWMKLNNGKGWEAMKHHPSQHLPAANQAPNSSNRPLVGGENTARAGINSGPFRGNLQQPLPPSPKTPGVKRTERQGAPGGALPKRGSGLAGGLTADVATPTASTQAQFQSSQAHLPNRMSTVNPGVTQTSNGVQNSRSVPQEDKPTAAEKFKKIICCGAR